MWTLRLGAAAVIAAFALAGCGGGGGGVDDVVEPPPPTQVQITMANQDSVGRAAFTSILPFVNLPGVELQPSPAPARAMSGGLAGLALKSVAIGVKQPAASGIVRSFAAYTVTEPCMLSGSITWTVDDRDNNNVFSAGDTILAEFNQCSDDDGSNLNGRLGMTISSISDTPTVFSLAGSTTLDRLTMRDQDAVLVAHGTLNFTIRETVVANGVEKQAEFTVASAGLTAGATGMAAGYSDTFVYFAGYKFTQHDIPGFEGMPATIAVTADGTVHSDTLNGEMTLHTPVAFRLLVTGNNPAEGQLDVIGYNNTKLELTALPNGSQIRMDVCDDGDGAWEGTKIVDWDWLIP